MSEKKIAVEEKVYIEPGKINSELISNIKSKVKSLLGACNPEYGYILKVYDDIDISRNKISSTDSGAFFQVKFYITSLKPNPGDLFEGKVCMIFSEGVFVDVMGKIKVLIPKDGMKGYEYNKEKNLFVSKGKQIKVNDTINVSIGIVKYEKGNFSCIGSLI